MEMLISTYRGTARNAGGAVAICVYSTVFGHKQAAVAAKVVPAAVIAAGGTTATAKAVLEALPLGAAALEKVPGITANIATAAGIAYQESFTKGLQYVSPVQSTRLLLTCWNRAIAFTTIGFGVVLIIAVFFCNDIGHKMNNKIEVFLENDKNAEKNEFHEELHGRHG